MCNGVCAPVEIVVVHAFIYTHAPEHDTRMIAVLHYHLAHVLHGLCFPLLAADMLPAGQLGEYEQSLAVALVDEIPALRIVRGAHGVAAELVL